MRHLLYLALVLAFTACGKSKSGESSGGSGGGGVAAGGGGETAGFDKLKVEQQGKPVSMTRAFIKRIPVDGRYQIFLSDEGGSCSELLDNMFNHKSDKALLFDVGPKLQADNKTLKTEITYVYVGGDTGEIKPGSSVALTGNADKGTKVPVTIDADITVTGSARPGPIAIHGSFTAEACGVSENGDKSGIPKAPHPSKATVTVGGNKLPIVGAIFKGAKPEAKDGVAQQRNLVLSTGPKDCSSTTQWAAFILEREWNNWKLRGEFPQKEMQNTSASDKDGQPETKGLTVKLGATGTSPDGPTVQVELGGSGTIGGVPVELNGTVEALDCP